MTSWMLNKNADISNRTPEASRFGISDERSMHPRSMEAINVRIFLNCNPIRGDTSFTSPSGWLQLAGSSRKADSEGSNLG